MFKNDIIIKATRMTRIATRMTRIIYGELVESIRVGAFG